MKKSTKVILAASLFMAAVAGRMVSFNSHLDPISPLLLSLTAFCGVGCSFVCWTLWGFFLEATFIMQGAIVTPKLFFIPVLTCIMIGLVMTILRVVLGKDKFMYAVPVIAYVQKWLLAFGQDFFMLLLLKVPLEYWGAYHAATEVWALSKCLDSFLWTLPLWAGYIGFVFYKRFKTNKSTVAQGMIA